MRFLSKRRSIILGSVLIIVIILVASFIIISRLSQPTSGIIRVGKSEATPNSFSVSLTPSLQTNQYVTFDYPVGLSAQPTKFQAPYVAEFIYKAADVETWILVIEIATSPSGSLNGNASFTTRKNNPAEYHENQLSINGQLVPVMTDTTAEAFSKVAFLIHGDLIATVSLLGDDASGTQPLQTSFNMVLDTWHWQ